MKLYLTLIGLCITIQMQAQSQFAGHSGVYFLGSANVPISTSSFSNPNINGAVVRFRWNDLEPSPGNFNWAFIDGEIAKAVTYNKKISLQPLGIPNWLGSIGAQQYYTIQDNPSSPNFGQITTGVIPWDSVYVSRFKIFLQNLSNKYANNPVVTYVNVIGGNFSRNLPDTVITDTTALTKQAFWTAHNYNADSLGALMNEMTDYYMGLFPLTPLWCSVDYITFQPNASGQPRNYLASIYSNYGITNYPDRFGLFREDVSGCNPNLSNIANTSHWYIMQQNPCRTGAQMLWSVQDGPTRMNQCGILPNTKTMVLDSAVNKGLALGMRYLEIYGSDIADAALTTSIQQANNKLIAKGLSCNPTSGLNEPTFENEFSIYPNPANEKLTINFYHNQNPNGQIQVFNSIGMLIKVVSVTQTTQLDISDLSNGLYFVRLKNNPQQTTKFFK
jgi:hypothetical protein